MRLHQLDHFVAAVDAGSLRAAARAQGLSHPALAKSLRLLEDDLGVALLRRSTRGVVCTPAGRALLARARVIRAEVHKAEDDLAQWTAPQGGSLSVGASPMAATLAADALARVLRAYPQARMRVMEGPPSVLVPLVRDETLDLALVVRMPATAGPGLRFRLLRTDRMAIACRRGHPLRKARSLQALATARWLGLNAPGAGGWLEHALTGAGLPLPAQYLQCESFAFGFELMARIDAVMAVPAAFLQGPLNREAQLAEIVLDRPLPPLDLGLCTRAEDRPTPVAGAFGRAVVDLARQLEKARRAA